MTLSHRANRLRHRDSSALAERFYFYRGMAIQSLNKQLDMEKRCTSNSVLAGVVALLLVDVSDVRLFAAYKRGQV